MDMKALRWFVWLGYPPLIACLVSVILNTREDIKQKVTPDIFNPQPPNKYEKAAFFYLPLYLMVFFYPVFHLLISLQNKLSRAIFIQIVSQLFSLFAGCSIVSVAFNTEGLKLKNQKADSLIIGLIILIIVQFYAYVSWTWCLFMKNDENHTSSAINANCRAQQYTLHQRGGCCCCCSSSCCSGAIEVIIFSFSVVSLIVYSVSVAVHWIDYHYLLYELTCSNFNLFCKVVQFIPSVLFLVLLTVFLLFLSYKKKQMVPCLSALSSLMSLFLGYAIYSVSMALSFYNTMLSNNVHVIGKTPLVLFQVQLAGGLLLAMAVYLINVKWIVVVYGMVKQPAATTVPRSSSDDNVNDEEGSRPLIPTSSGVYSHWKHDTVP